MQQRSYEEVECAGLYLQHRVSCNRQVNTSCFNEHAITSLQDAASSSGDEDGKDDAPDRRTQRPARTNALADSDDDDGQDAPSAKVSTPAAWAKLASKQQQDKRKTVLDEDSDSD